MADSVTIARPYAKAAFDFAKDANALALWHQSLQTLTAAVLDANAAGFLNNPSTKVSEHSDLLMSIVTAQHHVKDEAENTMKNFVDTLAINRRLSVLPEIFVLFDALRAEQEKTMVVHVASYSELSAIEQEKLIASLGKRLKRDVTLTTTIDKSLLGGAVIYADDLVIDGSVRGKINKLRTRLVA